MTITNSSSARRAGFKFNNKAFKKGADIAASKIGTRTLTSVIAPNDFVLSGAGVAMAVDGIFSSITLPDANAANLYATAKIPMEYAGGFVTLDIYWKTTAVNVANNIKFTVAMASKAGGESTALNDTQSVTQAPAAVSNQLRKASIVFSGIVFTAGDFVGIHILRDPADAADTLATDAKLIQCVLKFTGRA